MFVTPFFLISKHFSRGNWLLMFPSLNIFQNFYVIWPMAAPPMNHTDKIVTMSSVSRQNMEYFSAEGIEENWHLQTIWKRKVECLKYISGRFVRGICSSDIKRISQLVKSNILKMAGFLSWHQRQLYGFNLLQQKVSILSIWIILWGEISV